MNQDGVYKIEQKLFLPTGELKWFAYYEKTNKYGKHFARVFFGKNKKKVIESVDTFDSLIV